MLRYKKYYGVNHFDLSHYDYVIDTGTISKEQVVEKIIGILKEKHGLENVAISD